MAVEGLIEIIKRTLEAGDDVLVSGLGKFCVKSKVKRRGHNPATGSDLEISSRKVVAFKWSGKLRDKLNVTENPQQQAGKGIDKAKIVQNSSSGAVETAKA